VKSLNPQIIAVANQKGGVGKTTTCANLGIGLAQAGKKVLLVDADPQGSLTISLGNPQPDKLPFTLSDAMGRILMDEPIKPGEGILHHPEGVDLMPADIQLSGMEVSLVNAMSRETILRQYLDTVKGQYSHILIDCQPSLGMLTVNALAAAGRIIVPVQAEYLPAKGLEQLLSTISKVKRQLNPKLQIDGILLTIYRLCSFPSMYGANKAIIKLRSGIDIGQPRLPFLPVSSEDPKVVELKNDIEKAIAALD
jgi:chromosome partitioning protein